MFSASFKICIRTAILLCSIISAIQAFLEITIFGVLYSGHIFRPQDIYKSQIFFIFRKILRLGKYSSLPFILDRYLGPTFINKLPYSFALFATYAFLGLVAGLFLGTALWLLKTRKGSPDAEKIYRITLYTTFVSWLFCNTIIFLARIREAKFTVFQRLGICLFLCAAALALAYLFDKFFYRALQKHKSRWLGQIVASPVITCVILFALFLPAAWLLLRFHDHAKTFPHVDFTRLSNASLTYKPNVILISIDSLRADHLSCYGYARITSPHIDDLAKDALLFTNAFSATSWTLAAHRSLLTSTFAEANDFYSIFDPIRSDQMTIAEVLRKVNYSTAGFVSGPLLSRRFGFHRGFQLYDDFTIRFASAKESHGGVTSPHLHQSVQRWLRSNSTKPFFLFLHYWDVHYDYTPPAPYNRMFDPEYKGTMTAENFIYNKAINSEMDPKDLAHIVALYDGEIAFTDSYLGRLFDELKRLNLYDDSLIILTADHGDEFFEHGYKGHMRTLYDEVLHIPLIIKFPVNFKSKAGTRIHDVVSIVDIMPTILSYLGFTNPANVQKRSLMPRIQGNPAPQNDYVYASLKNELFALRSNSSKLIQRSNLPQKEFYDLSEDPEEKDNIYKNGNKELVAKADQQVLMLLDVLNVQRMYLRNSHPHRVDVPEEMDQALKEQLKALGYLQ